MINGMVGMFLPYNYNFFLRKTYEIRKKTYSVANNIQYSMPISETRSTLVASNKIYLFNKSGIQSTNGLVTLKLCVLHESIAMLDGKHQ